MKVDNMSMAASIEARCPFLDHRLMEYVARIPTEMKLNGSISKYMLKQVAKDILPESILNRPKHSFSVPIGQWLNGSLRELTCDLIAEGILKGSGLFNVDYMRGRMWQGLQRDEPGVARQLWSLLHLGLWAKQYRVDVG